MPPSKENKNARKSRPRRGNRGPGDTGKLSNVRRRSGDQITEDKHVVKTKEDFPCNQEVRMAMCRVLNRN